MNFVQAVTQVLTKKKTEFFSLQNYTTEDGEVATKSWCLIKGEGSLFQSILKNQKQFATHQHCCYGDKWTW